MGTEPKPTEAISRCFDGCACASARRSRRRPVSGVSRALLAALDREGLGGRSILELGCGVGGLSRELLARGAERATGVDLSPKSIDEAVRLAGESGLADRVLFRVGDGATEDLAPHDVVVLDKVMCCYPDVEALLANSIPAAGAVYGFVVPWSRGLRGVVARVSFGAFNTGLRIIRRSFRGYVHDIAHIDATVRAAGLELRSEGRHTIWRVAVFARPAPA